MHGTLSVPSASIARSWTTPDVVSSDDRPDAEELPARLRLAVGRLNRRLRVDSAAVLPPLQSSVLVTLETHEPLRLSELARREAVTPPTMSRVLAALDEAGLLVRTPDPQDGRSSLVSITDEGSELLTAVRARKDAFLARRLRRLSAEERATLRRASDILEKLLEDPE